MLIYIESCYFLSGKESSRLRQNGEREREGWKESGVVQEEHL